MIIVIDGPDGSGKTTISRQLQKELKYAGINVGYMKFELNIENLLISGFMYKLFKKFFKTYKEVHKKEYGNVLLGKKEASVGYYVLSNFIIVDKALTSIFIKLKNKRKTLIVDAYLYDNLVPFYCRGLVSKRIYETIISLGNIIRGDIEIILDGPSKKLFERRKGIDYDSIEFVECNRRHFKDIAQRLNSPIIYVDSPINMTIKKVHNVILKQLPEYNQEEHLLHILSDPFLDIDGRKDELLSLFDFQKIDWDKVISIAEKQKILLPLLRNVMSLPVDEKIKYKLESDLNKVLKLRHKRLELIKEVVDVFNENNINYAIFKSLPPFFSELDSDLDILIDPDDIPRAIDALKRESWVPTVVAIKNNKRIIDPIILLYPSVGLYKHGFEIDFHDFVPWGNFRILRNEIKDILEYKKKEIMSGIEMYVLPKEYELVFVIAHAICKHRRINLWDIHTLRGLFKKKLNIKKVNYILEKYNIKNLINLFLYVYRIKNIFYWNDVIPKAFDELESLYTNYSRQDWRKVVVKSELSLSTFKRLLSLVGLEDIYNFYREFTPMVRKPKLLYATYKNKWR
ncbi:hypothetical protein A3L04_02675 [Thermococcus chitonophagus]|uniref:Uncharacterized protein n=1 Tax=Thermococcus chitonophagus TaxID=54262 RepID=A0A160VQZ2_9EURY|nr:nucleotidyltransferase family protein [Thermococcus chitonophagus]ASJ16060.1 hypothetical protein A3L04_02675 [Thermococcus chitonophagus]CUX77307.1 hypothetical protein CHITON_0528 [Thermococcus chitonophagus]